MKINYIGKCLVTFILTNNFKLTVLGVILINQIEMVCFSEMFYFSKVHTKRWRHTKEPDGTNDEWQKHKTSSTPVSRLYGDPMTFQFWYVPETSHVVVKCVRFWRNDEWQNKTFLHEDLTFQFWHTPDQITWLWNAFASDGVQRQVSRKIMTWFKNK